MPTQTQTAEPGPQARYEAYLNEGRFMLQRDRASGEFFFYPRVAAPRSGSRDVEWAAPSGLGRIYAATVIHPRPPETPYGVVLVVLVALSSYVDPSLAEERELRRKLRDMETREAAAQDVRIGARVRARVVQEAGCGVLVFEPVAEQA